MKNKENKLIKTMSEPVEKAVPQLFEAQYTPSYCLINRCTLCLGNLRYKFLNRLMFMTERKPARMKRTSLFVLLAALLTAFAFTGCSNESAVAGLSPDALLEAALSPFDADGLPEYNLYSSGAEEGGENYLDPDAAGLYFYGEFAAEVTALKNASSYALLIPATKRVFEIDIIKAGEGQDISELKELLEARLARKNNGDIANYAPEEQPQLDAAEIFTVGNYAVLAATTDNGAVERIIRERLAETASSADTASNDTSLDETASDGMASGGVTSGDIVDLTSVTDAIAAASEDNAESIDGENRSEIPDLTFVKHVENDVVAIGGSCAEDAVIHIRGGAEEVITHNDHGSFLTSVKLPSSGSAILHVTAEQPGKEESKPYIITAYVRNDVTFITRMGAYHHFYGDYLQSFVMDEVGDFTGATVLSDSQIASAKKNIKGRADYLAELGCKLVYLVVPTPMHIYPEWVPEEYVPYEGERRIDQFEKLATEAGATVINLYDTFMEHKSDEFKIFFRTDTHWTYYGAYLGYLELMKVVSAGWKDAAARTTDEVTFYNEWSNMGDIAEHTESDPSLLREYATFVRFNFDNEFFNDIFYTGTCRLNHSLMSMQITTVNKQRGGLDLPKAYILRDSFGTSIYPFISDAFSSVYWAEMWSYDFSKSKIKSFMPDYFIYVVTERNLGSVIA